MSAQVEENHLFLSFDLCLLSFLKGRLDGMSRFRRGDNPFRASEENGRLEDLFAFAARLQRKHGLSIACFGHAGDGNIHTNVMVDLTQPGAERRAEAALDELFRWVIAAGGAISGEHGIGLAKKRWWPLAVSKEARDLHRTVKRALDPKGILNPGKFV